MDQDLARPRRNELLDRRVDRIGIPIGALDAVGPEQAAEELGLGLSGDNGQDDGLVWIHS